MRLFIRTLGAVLTALYGSGLLGGCSPAWACSCGAQTDQEYFAGATHVFTGTPIARREADVYYWTFRVESLQKGEVPDTQEVAVKRSSVEQCGFTFKDGATYQVYAFSEGGALRTGLCSGTRELTPTVETYEPKGSTKPEPAKQGTPAEPNSSPQVLPSGPLGSPAGPATPGVEPQAGAPSPAAGERTGAEDGRGFPGAAVVVGIAALVLIAGLVAALGRRRAG